MVSSILFDFLLAISRNVIFTFPAPSATSTPVFDQTGYLMYQGVCYEILGKESVGVVDYYDLEISSLTIPDTILYGGWVYPVTEVYDDVFSYSYDLKTLAVGNNVRVLGELVNMP